mgnify:CR=1 FL=1
MVNPQLGTKRIDPETGRKFYDLNKDPIVSPFTGKSYPRSYFEGDKAPVEEKVEEPEVVEVEAAPDTVSLQDVAEEENDSDSSDLPDVDDDSDDADDDDTFLEDEEDDDDVSDIIGGGREDDED